MVDLQAQVDQRWFLFMTGEEGMRQVGSDLEAAAPATVTGEVPLPLTERSGRRGPWGQNPRIRKPGDLPARTDRPADGVFRDRVKAGNRPLWPMPLCLWKGHDGRYALRLYHLQSR